MRPSIAARVVNSVPSGSTDRGREESGKSQRTGVGTDEEGTETSDATETVDGTEE